MSAVSRRSPVRLSTAAPADELDETVDQFDDDALVDQFDENRNQQFRIGARQQLGNQTSEVVLNARFLSDDPQHVGE